MKVIIAGTRTITDKQHVEAAIHNSGFTITEVVSEGAKGVDALGENWALANHIPIKTFPAQWDDLSHPQAIIRERPNRSKYNVAAGPIRNQQMAEYADALILIMVQSGSRGAEDILRKAQAKGLQIYLHLV